MVLLINRTKSVMIECFCRTIYYTAYCREAL